MRIEIRRVAFPELATPVVLPSIAAAEYEARAGALSAAAGALGLDWTLVHGDRGHFANMIWLTGYDPRFEEALLLLGPDGRRLLLVGIEGLFYAKDAGLPVDLRFYHPFSILGQPHVDSPPLRELLEEAGIGRGANVGIVGWKTGDRRDIDPDVPCFVPAMLVHIDEHVTATPLIDITRLMLDPETGLRIRNSADQIARFEWGAVRASSAVLRVVRGVRPGMTELEAAGLMGLQGEPMSVHPLVIATDGGSSGLRSPSARAIGAGDAVTVGVGLWGGLTCRAGMITAAPDDCFWEQLVRPYVSALATWWQTVGIDVEGGTLDAAVRAAIGDAPFAPFVNPGHMTSYDEWVHSPVLAGSRQRIASGMMLQCDIIPTPLPPGRAINCEDTLVIADERLRGEIAERHPAVWARIGQSRALIQEKIGIELKPEVLPLSCAPAYLPPCWLEPERVCVAVG